MKLIGLSFIIAAITVAEQAWTGYDNNGWWRDRMTRNLFSGSIPLLLAGVGWEIIRRSILSRHPERKSQSAEAVAAPKVAVTAAAGLEPMETADSSEAVRTEG